MDKSSFLHHGTGIPKEIAFFFSLGSVTIDDPKPAHIIFSGKRYYAVFQMDKALSREK